MIAILGLALQVVILKTHDEKSVGVFSQLYALYLLLSQFAVAGVQLSIQSYIPKHQKLASHQNVILTSSIIYVIVSSTFIALVGFIFKDLVKVIYSHEVYSGYLYILPGLVFFSVNKVLLSFHNGNRRMKSFAVLSLLRFVFMLAALLMLIYWNQPSYMFAGILSIAECALTIVLVFFSLSFFKPTLSKRTFKWFYIHYRFGSRSLLGNFLLDVNTKVDVLMLGAISGDKMVGLYSIAAQIFEGLLLLPTIFRNNINPIISRSHFSKTNELTGLLIRKNIKKFYMVLSPVSILSLLGFPIVLLIYNLEENFWMVFQVYAILCSGLIFSSGFLPFQMIFNQTGNPNLQTIYFFLYFLTNVILNFVFISLFGIYGAALGTSLALIFQIPILKHISSQRLNINF